MAQRIKVTGYIEVDELPQGHVDLEDPTGLSAEGYAAIVYGGEEWGFSDLCDLELELEEEAN